MGSDEVAVDQAVAAVQPLASVPVVPESIVTLMMVP
jgi:hypothetical protein